MRSIALVLSLVLVLLGACSEDQNPLTTQNSTDDSGVMLQKAARPFQGTGTAQVVTRLDMSTDPPMPVNPNEAPYDMIVDLAGTANVTHLGLTNVTGVMYVDWNTVWYVPPPADPSIPKRFYGIFKMWITFIAADGSKVFMTSMGTLTTPELQLPNLFPTVNTLLGDLTVIGGEGRFEGATGSGQAIATEELLQLGGPHSTTVNFTGSITY